MATITPTRATAAHNVSTVTWTGIATGDTINSDLPGSLDPAFGAVQISGTFGGATVTLTGSNDGTTFSTLKDKTGTAISMTSAGAAEFSTAMVYIKPGISGGTGDSVDVVVSFRNQ